MTQRKDAGCTGKESRLTSLAGKTVTVIGLGRFGGGVGVTQWLCAQGARVIVSDKDVTRTFWACISRNSTLRNDPRLYPCRA